MFTLKYTPICHDQKTLLLKAYERKGFKQAYDDLVANYKIINQSLKSNKFTAPQAESLKLKTDHSRKEQ